MRQLRGCARLVALFMLVLVLVGVPLALVAVVGVPFPSASQLHRLWSLRSFDDDTIVRLGAALFSALWLWFACTALAEAARVVRHRWTGRPLDATDKGPVGWVRGVVRFVALSSAAASLLGGVGHHAASALVTSPPRPVITAARVRSDAAGTVLQIAGAATEPDATPPVVSNGVSPLTSYLSGMGTALLLAVGVVRTVEARRRRQWRSVHDGIDVEPRDVALVHVERTLRSVHGDDRLARLDVALRSIARDLARQRSGIRAVIIAHDGSIRVTVDGRPVPSVPGWCNVDHGSEWTLAPDESLERLAASAGDVVAPCPALVHLGVLDDGGDVFVDLEAIGVLSLRTPFADDVARAVASSLAFSPFMQGGHVVLSGAEVEPIADGGTVAAALRVDSLDDALRTARRLLGSTLVNASSVSTFALRVQGAAGESWEPAVVVCCGGSASSGPIEVAASSGLALVTDRADASPWSLAFVDGRHVLEPLGWHVRPIGIGHHDVVDVVALAADARGRDVIVELPPPTGLPAPVALPPATLSGVPGREDRGEPPAPFVEPPWALMVRVLGPVSVVDRNGVVVEFERSKSLELVTWLCLHRDRPTRSAARTALWDLDVRAATFANVVSDARRGLARAVLPLEGDEWIARTLTEDLPLHSQVVTDAELLAARLEYARCQPDVEAIETLRPGVELLRSLPLTGTNFIWSDAEGHTSSLVVLALSAATELAERCLAVGDVDGVFWATGQGLKVLAGHEELIALRMRAHAGRGDLAGVRSEWASYERALAADTWSAPDPAPKLVSLRKTLLG